jgi:hypothetical protein
MRPPISREPSRFGTCDVNGQSELAVGGQEKYPHGHRGCPGGNVDLVNRIEGGDRTVCFRRDKHVNEGMKSALLRPSI